ncbi:MAG: glycoside hydrolase family 43 protein [Chloroflexi bacterium]|nr:glycoside hydrolase family 43 protein [Chloroflexota bacterium]
MEARAANAQGTFTNPVYPGYFADPFVRQDGGQFYAYGTNTVDSGDRAFEVLRSADLASWTSLGRSLPAVDDLRVTDHWAPEVAEEGGRYYMYFSAGVDDRGHQLRVAVADRPEGPFRPEGSILTPDEPFAIDPHPFRDDDGQWYLYYARDLLEGDRVGTSLVVDRLVDMVALGGAPVPVLGPSADWQLFQAQRPMYGGVYDWYTLEGPFVVKRMGRYWCLYSGGAWTGADYGVSYAVADAPLGPFVAADTAGPALLRSLPGGLEGPGHASVVVGPDRQDYLAYHAWDPDHTARRMCIDRLDWTDDGPRTGGPTVGPQPLPNAVPPVRGAAALF